MVIVTLCLFLTIAYFIKCQQLIPQFKTLIVRCIARKMFEEDHRDFRVLSILGVVCFAFLGFYHRANSSRRGVLNFEPRRRPW